MVSTDTELFMCEAYRFAFTGETVELEISHEEPAKREAPLRALVILQYHHQLGSNHSPSNTHVPALGNGLICTIIRVVVVASILAVRRVKGLHTKRSAKHSIGNI